MNPIIEKVAERAALDELIVKAVSSGITKRAVAKQFAITPAQVDLAIGRMERRQRMEASPYLSHKFPVRMANALCDRGVNGEDDDAVLKFIFNEPEALRYPMLGRKTLKESQKIAREWLKDKPELLAQFKATSIVEKVAAKIDAVLFDPGRNTHEQVMRAARAAIRATLQHYAENVSEGIDKAPSMEEARLLQHHKRFFMKALAELDERKTDDVDHG